jgi:hypothetical protein
VKEARLLRSVLECAWERLVVLRWRVTPLALARLPLALFTAATNAYEEAEDDLAW